MKFICKGCRQKIDGGWFQGTLCSRCVFELGKTPDPDRSMIIEVWE